MAIQQADQEGTEQRHTRLTSGHIGCWAVDHATPAHYNGPVASTAPQSGLVHRGAPPLSRNDDAETRDTPPLKKFTSALLLAAGLTSAGSVGANTEMQDLSYSLGALIGDRILKPYEELDYDRLMEGLKAAHQNGELEIDLNAANQIVQEQSQKAQEAATASARADGEAFLAAQAEREGVMATGSGLLYQINEPGEGATPAATDQVTVHYEGRLIDGTVFDSSIARGEPTSFALNQVIPGWTEGLQLMPVGSKYTFYIPSDLAYGERGAGGSIGPHQALIFDVELISIGN